MFIIVLRSIIQTCILMRTCTKSNCFIHSWGHGEVPAIIVNMNYCLITEIVAKAQFKAELIGVKSTSNHCTCHFQTSARVCCHMLLRKTREWRHFNRHLSASPGGTYVTFSVVFVKFPLCPLQKRQQLIGYKPVYTCGEFVDPKNCSIYISVGFFHIKALFFYSTYILM